jgi:fructose-1-phosphate kinase PfkB-like protein
VPPYVVAEAIAALRARNIPTWLDASGELLRVGINARPSGIKPNIEEIRELCGACNIPFNAANPTAAAEAVRDKFELDEMLLTLGARGAARITAEGAVFAPVRDAQRGHATGAGDAFLGAYLCARARGMGGGDALKEAVAAGGKAMTTTEGTPSFAEATARLREERRKAEKNNQD